MSSSNREKVARLTSEISSSSKAGSWNGAVLRQNISATDPVVGVAKGADGISAGDPPVDATKDAPATPNTDTALRGKRFALEGRFARGIAEASSTFLRSNPQRTCCIASTFSRPRIARVEALPFVARSLVRNRQAPTKLYRRSSFLGQIAAALHRSLHGPVKRRKRSWAEGAGHDRRGHFACRPVARVRLIGANQEFRSQVSC
jgi:hypothetical protein